MFDWIRKNAALLTGVLLVWMTYSDLDAEAGEKKAVAKGKLAGIPKEYFVQRDPDQPLVELRDPCQLIVRETTTKGASSRSARQSSSTAAGTDGGLRFNAPAWTSTPEQVAGAWAGAMTKLSGDLVAGMREWDPLGLGGHAEQMAKEQKAEVAAKKALAARPPAHFELVLDSVLHMPGGGVARISGQTVNVGDPLLGMDDYSPPVLKQVTSSRAVVAWREETYVLDLDTRPRVSVGTALPVLAGDVAPAARAAGAKNPRAPSVKRKTNNGYRVRGKMGDK